MDFPTRIDEVTVEWLNGALRESGVLGERRVVGFEAARTASRGGTSSARVLTLAYDAPAAGLPEKVLAKFSSESEEIREKVREHRLYEREVAFYRRYGADAGIPTPICYAARFDARANTCVLLLEHLELAEGAAGPETDARQYEAAIRCLAPFHARWWGRTPELACIEREDDPSVVGRRARQAARAWDRIRAGNHRAFVGEPAAAILELWLAETDAWAAYARRRPWTLCHGSFHRDQILFPRNGGDRPRVIDWQSVSLQAGANDLARLVVGGLRPPTRRAQEGAWLELYHGLLMRHGVRGYGKDELLDDYRLAIVNLLVFHSLILADYPVEVVAKYWPGADSFWEVLFGWPGDAAEEWGVLDWFRNRVRASRVGGADAPSR